MDRLSAIHSVLPSAVFQSVQDGSKRRAVEQGASSLSDRTEGECKEQFSSSVADANHMSMEEGKEMEDIRDKILKFMESITS